MRTLLVIIASILAILGLFGVYVLWTLTVLARRKAYCWKVLPCEDVEFGIDLYQEKCREARARGLKHCGLFEDYCHSSVTVYLSLWLNETRQILVCINIVLVHGKNAQADVSFQLFSQCEDGRFVITDNLENWSDLTGQDVEHVSRENTLTRMLVLHQERLASVSRNLRTFDADNAITVFKAFETERIQKLVENGYAKYLDVQKTMWRYNLKGALKRAVPVFSGLIKEETQKEIDKRSN